MNQDFVLNDSLKDFVFLRVVFPYMLRPSSRLLTVLETENNIVCAHVPHLKKSSAASMTQNIFSRSAASMTKSVSSPSLVMSLVNTTWVWTVIII